MEYYSFTTMENPYIPNGYQLYIDLVNMVITETGSEIRDISP